MIRATREQARRVARLQRLLLLATRREERMAREAAGPQGGASLTVDRSEPAGNARAALR